MITTNISKYQYIIIWHTQNIDLRLVLISTWFRFFLIWFRLILTWFRLVSIQFLFVLNRFIYFELISIWFDWISTCFELISDCANDVYWYLIKFNEIIILLWSQLYWYLHLFSGLLKVTDIYILIVITMKLKLPT